LILQGKVEQGQNGVIDAVRVDRHRDTSPVRKQPRNPTRNAGALPRSRAAIASFHFSERIAGRRGARMEVIGSAIDLFVA